MACSSKSHVSAFLAKHDTLTEFVVDTNKNFFIEHDDDANLKN